MQARTGTRWTKVHVSMKQRITKLAQLHWGLSAHSPDAKRAFMQQFACSEARNKQNKSKEVDKVMELIRRLFSPKLPGHRAVSRPCPQLKFRAFLTFKNL